MTPLSRDTAPCLGGIAIRAQRFGRNFSSPYTAVFLFIELLSMVLRSAELLVATMLGAACRAGESRIEFSHMEANGAAR